MTTKKKSAASRFLESVAGKALTFGGLLIAIREGEEMSQIEFAKLLGVSRSHLCDIEKGRKSVTPERAAKFARILGYGEAQFVRLSLQALVEAAGLNLQVDVKAA
jgi:transcriptional regulator with XRE-family HTH domain